MPKELYFPASVELEVDVKPEDGEIADVGPYTHTVRWRKNGGAESAVRYCNRCGSPYGFSGRLKAEVDPQQRCIQTCAECHVFHGFDTSGRWDLPEMVPAGEQES